MSAAPTRPFSLLVKPAGADCNLNCGYCFYLAKSGLYPDVPTPRMTMKTVEQMLRAFFAIPMPVYAFGWQGGEPTLMGLEFFQEVFELQKSLAPAGSTVTNGLQTNGTLLTPAWASLLRDNDVLVGLSIDGPAHLHNRHRRWAQRDGSAIPGKAGNTHARIEETIRMLREERVPFNALTVVGQHNVGAPVEVYDYLRSLRIRHMQFIPLVEWAAEDAGTGGAPLPTAFSVTGEGWGQFLSAIFDRWFPRDVRRVSIRHHDSILELLVHGQYNVCTMSDACGGHLVVEHNGDLYPCDFYVESALKLGSVHDATHDAVHSNPLAAAMQSEASRAFALQKARRSDECATCQYRRLCGGDCPKLRAPSDDGRGLSALCEGWTAYYDHSLNDFLRLSRSLSDHPAVGAEELING